MPLIILPPPTSSLAVKMQGVWWLQSREDWTTEGLQKIDPVLGSNPTGILSYAKVHFAAQFMRQDRAATPVVSTNSSAKNNTATLDGYDAYFGTYKVDEATGKVAHTLSGSVMPSNIGLTVSRNLRVHDDQLIIQLETSATDGTPVIRTLIWKRIS